MSSQNNPLLEASKLDFNVPRFDLIKDAHYEPAFNAAIAQARKNIESIKSEAGTATFSNTIEALELSSDQLDVVTNVFFNLLNTDGNDFLRDLAKKVSPQLAEFNNDIILDENLFVRIEQAYQEAESANLTTEQKMLLDKTYKSFIRNGAKISEQEKNKIREIDQKLAVLSQEFQDHLLHETNAFELEITDEKDLAGLPDSSIAVAKKVAEDKGKKSSWIFNLDAPSYVPFMRYSEKRALREKVWRAYLTRATNGKRDNRSIVMEMSKLRYQRANVLGYKTHADFVLEERMASDPTKVNNFLEKMLDASKKAALKDLEDVKDFRNRLDGKNEVMPWDFSYYSEKLKVEKFKFNDEDLRPYFKLENAVAGVFKHAELLYGLEFKTREDLPGYHSEVEVYEVKEKDSQKTIGVFYMDLHPRETKRGGAWMTVFQEQGLKTSGMAIPHVSIVCNLTKPTADKPSLLTYDELRTLFHEFGHSLHGLLSKCHYQSISGTNVFWDFVELPSQLMENWIKEKEGLDLFAKHYETNEPIPKSLVQKIQDSSKFLAGYGCIRQMQFAMLDMSWHGVDPSEIEDVESYEIESTKETALFDHIKGTMVSTSFAHIFGGGYSSGYYSYKWAEVLEADVFEVFKQKGLFNSEVSKKLREDILSKGGSEHPMELFKRFRGREPDPQYLLKRDGLV